MNREEIKQFLPHREPMLLVDEMIFKFDVLRFVVRDLLAAQYLRQRGFPAFAAAHQNEIFHQVLVMGHTVKSSVSRQ